MMLELILFIYYNDMGFIHDTSYASRKETIKKKSPRDSFLYQVN